MSASADDEVAESASAGPRSEYRVVELSTVTDEELTRCLNDEVGRGWTLDGIHFAMRESSKRPSMAFVLFTRPVRREQNAPDAGPADADPGDAGASG